MLCPHGGRKSKLSHITLILACASFGEIKFDTSVVFPVSGHAYNCTRVLCSQRTRVYLNSESLPDVTLAQNFRPRCPRVLCPQSTFYHIVIFGKL